MKLPPFTKTYECRKVLSFAGCTLPEGGITAVIGSNGSGKSTLAKVLCGIEKADNGTAPCQGIKVGCMPQKNFAFRMSVEANVLVAGGDKETAQELMERLGITHLKKQRAKRLSGGETARMALARLLLHEYDLLILDEPTAAMDMESTALTEEVIREYCRKHHCTVLWVTHSLQQARRAADHVLFLKDGELCEEGAAEKVLYRPEKEETKKFLQFYGE